ncbi:MAG: peptidoglycan-binding protein LysM [Herminiimonas sp.]|nr:peptidoglycan-binding protein LysM [Herminiimonas sp.]
MSLLSFIKEAGEKLFNPSKSETAAATASSAPVDVEALNQKAADAISTYIGTQNLDVKDLSVAFDGASGTVTVAGTAADQATREKIVLCCGNVSSVSNVDDQLTVAEPSDEGRYYTVKSGDTLSAIAKHMYDDANKYPVIFEANKPMLKSPERIYPGQMLRIPALAG